MLLSDQSWVPFAAALGIGLLIGTERERRKSQGPTRVAAGLRTFTVASLLGAVAQAMGGEILLALAMLTVGAMAAVAYWRGHAEDPGMTTGITLVLTLLLGGLAMQNATLAAALAVAVTALLVGKSWMHGFVRQAVTQGEFNEALALAAASLVVLPLIPDRFLGPLDAFNPRSLWLVVVLMMVVGAAGHVAQRLLGAGAGLSLSGFASGFVSSVATIAAMGERAVRTPGLLGAAVAGAVLSSLATILQLVAVLAATSPETLYQLVIPLGCAGFAATAYGGFFALCALRQPSALSLDPGPSFNLKTALGLALTITSVTVLSAFAQEMLGSQGLLAATALAGFADAHAGAVALASLVNAGKATPGSAIVPILCGLTTNTVTKAIVATSMGGRRFASQILPGLALTVGAAWLGYALSTR